MSAERSCNVIEKSPLNFLLCNQVIDNVPQLKRIEHSMVEFQTSQFHFHDKLHVFDRFGKASLCGGSMSD